MKPNAHYRRRLVWARYDHAGHYPFLNDEVSNVCRHWKAGIVRENYARADEPAGVIVFEPPGVAQAKIYTDDFPLSGAGLLERLFIPLQVPLLIETLFRSDIDLNEPLDRTAHA